MHCLILAVLSLAIATSSYAQSTLEWSGGTGAWDVGVSSNWNNGTLHYSEGDIVLFTDSASTFHVTIPQTVSPGFVAFSNSEHDYTLIGEGISGPGGLIVSGSGKATLSTSANSFTGGIVVNSGTLILDADQAAFSGGITLASGAALEVGIPGATTNKDILPDWATLGGISLGPLSTMNVNVGETIQGLTGIGHVFFVAGDSRVADNTGFQGRIRIAAGASLAIPTIASAGPLGTTHGTTTVGGGGRVIFQTDPATDAIFTERFTFGSAGAATAVVDIEGKGLLSLQGTIFIGGATELRLPDSNAELEIAGSMSGGKLHLTNAGAVNITGTLGIAPQGFQKSGSGTLTLLNTVYADGPLEIREGKVELKGAAKLNTAPSILIGPAATLDALDVGGVALGKNRALQLDGALDGNVTVQGSVVAGNGLIQGNLITNLESTIAPGDSVVPLALNGIGTLYIAGDFTQSSASVLSIDLAAADDFDSIDVAGNLNAAGSLTINLRSGFQPALNDSFDVLDFSALSGEFHTLEFPPLGPGLVWDPSLLLSQGVLRVVANPHEGNADFDGNDRVDGRDFLVWQRGNGTAGDLTSGDADANGFVDKADLLVWQAQFGTSGGISTAAAASVPEPTGIITMSFLLLFLATLTSRERVAIGSPR
jgi:autotransporter-associated beta strand protein